MLHWNFCRSPRASWLMLVLLVLLSCWLDAISVTKHNIKNKKWNLYKFFNSTQQHRQTKEEFPYTISLRKINQNICWREHQPYIKFQGRVLQYTLYYMHPYVKHVCTYKQNYTCNAYIHTHINTYIHITPRVKWKPRYKKLGLNHKNFFKS